MGWHAHPVTLGECDLPGAIVYFILLAFQLGDSVA